MSISIPIILRNALKMDYPIDRVVKSVVDLADEIILSVDPTSEDFSVEFCQKMAKQYGNVRVFESKWDLSNVSSSGAEFSRQTNISIGQCKSDWIFLLQADEAIHEKDFDLIRSYTKDSPDAYSMHRLYFWYDINTVRFDWSNYIVRFFRKGTRHSAGDAYNTDGGGEIKKSPIIIYHYSRIGDPNTISKRIHTLDTLFHSKNKLLKEEDLEPYNFETYNFDCLHKEGVDVGRKKVEEPVLMNFIGTHPKPFMDYR